MNYFSARQRKSGRFDYTCMNDGRVWPIGYCAGYREWTEDDAARLGLSLESMQKEQAESGERRELYHTDGHATKEDACACYREYVLDTSIRFREDRPEARTQRKCCECDVFTSGNASVGQYEMWPLCKDHRTREIVAKLYGVVGDSVSS